MSVYSIEDLEKKESSLKEGQVEQGGEAPASEPAKGEEGGKPIGDNDAQEAPKAEEIPVTSEPSSQIDIEKLIEEKINKLKESGEIVDKDTYEQQVKDLKLNREAIEKELKRNLEVDLDNVSASKNLLIENLMEAEGISRSLAEMQVERNYPNLFDEAADEEDRNYTFDKEKFKHDVNKILNNKKTKLEELLSKTTDVANVEELQAKVAEQLTQKQQEQQQKFVKSWEDYSSEVSKNFGDSLTHKVGDNEFVISLDDADKSSIQNFTKSIPNFIQNFSENGKFSQEKYAEFVKKAVLFDKIVERVAQDSATLGENKKFKETKSASKVGTPAPQTTDKEKQLEDILSRYTV